MTQGIELDYHDTSGVPYGALIIFLHPTQMWEKPYRLRRFNTGMFYQKQDEIFIYLGLISNDDGDMICTVWSPSKNKICYFWANPIDIMVLK